MAMVELDQMKFELQSYENTLHEVKDSLDLEGKKKRIEELEMEMEAPGFWDDPDSSNRKMKELKNLKDTAELCNKLETQYSDIETLIEMGHEEEDPDMVEEIRGELDEFIEELDELRISTLLSGEYDKDNAILKLNAGAGGTESCDWCGMLYRMYTRWAEKKGFSVEVLDYLDGEEAGIKSVTFQVNGENAYGYLKSEKGVHRLVRISPFNAQGKRQTSFVSLDVMPDIEEDLDIEINPEDLRTGAYVYRRKLHGRTDEPVCSGTVQFCFWQSSGTVSVCMDKCRQTGTAHPQDKDPAEYSDLYGLWFYRTGTAPKDPQRF